MHGERPLSSLRKNQWLEHYIFYFGSVNRRRSRAWLTTPSETGFTAGPEDKRSQIETYYSLLTCLYNTLKADSASVSHGLI